ncbi:hypothetical protein Tco_0453099 [Tanacetum coccineum]
MEMKDTLSSCSDSEEQEIQLLQIQAKVLKANSMNKHNALKTTIQRLSNHDFPMTFTFKQAFKRLFGEDERTFKFKLDNNMKNLKTQLNKETLQEKNSKSTIRVINAQFQKFIHSEVLNSGDKDNSGFVSEKGNDQSLENQSSTSRNESSRSRNECNESCNPGDDTDIRPYYDTEPMAEVPYTAEYNMFAVEIQHFVQPENMNNASLMEKVDSNTTPDLLDLCNNEFKDDQNTDDHGDEHVVLANLIANLKLNVNENKKIQKQLRNANTSLTHELKECKSTLEETNKTLGESNRTRDRYLIALHDK